MSESLAAFITRMLDHDEAVARAAGGHGWHVSAENYLALPMVVMPNLNPSKYVPADAVMETAGSTNEQTEHIALHDPARVLAGVAAKRRLFGLHEGIDRSSGFPNCAGCGEPILGMVTPPRCHTLLALASEWADDPGYDREAWGE